MKELICEYCGKEFEGNSTPPLVCSDKCLDSLLHGKPKEGEKVLYRYERGWTNELKVTVYLYTYKVERETPKGYWIKVYGGKKWVSNDSVKRYAYPTKEEAMTNFKKRTNRCVKIQRSMLTISERYQKALEKGFSDDEVLTGVNW